MADAETLHVNPMSPVSMFRSRRFMWNCYGFTPWRLEGSQWTGRDQSLIGMKIDSDSSFESGIDCFDLKPVKWSTLKVFGGSVSFNESLQGCVFPNFSRFLSSLSHSHFVKIKPSPWTISSHKQSKSSLHSFSIEISWSVLLVLNIKGSITLKFKC